MKGVCDLQIALEVIGDASALIVENVICRHGISLCE